MAMENSLPLNTGRMGDQTETVSLIRNSRFICLEL